MAVRANDAVARRHDALLGQEGMLDAHFAHVKEMKDVVFVGEIPALFGLGRALDVLVGDEMVQHDVDAGPVKDRVKARLLEFIDGDGGGDIVAKHHVQFCIDELARLDAAFAAVGGQDLLGHGHSHNGCSFLL